MSYSCATAAETLEWISAIIEFISPYSFFWESNVVNFLTDRLWEAVDKEWIDCLRNEPVEHLIQIPSGFIKEQWPCSLKKFISISSSLAFPREKKVLPNIDVALLNNVIAQGMNQKKRHEVEALAAVVSSIAKDVEANTVIDVGAGQGYLSQVVCFEYGLSVTAIDASCHHGKITDARAQRINKYYHHHHNHSLGGRGELKTVTCRVLSSEMLKSLLESDSMLLTGLHACGDLSVTMLKTFLESEEVKAVVSIGCCYNLLSEDDDNSFPISSTILKRVRVGLHLPKSARDLACQSADRWRDLEKDEGIHNFELHAFRAAFQMVLCRYFPESLRNNPRIGRQGKVLRKEKTTSSTINGGDRSLLFEKFSRCGMQRLNLKETTVDFRGIWKEAQPFSDLIGAYWSLRATLGPVLETLILLDRLLFLQEKENEGIEASMIPIFDPNISPRNIALIGIKKK